MALIKCQSCGSQVSDKARVCPKCHAPIDVSTIPSAVGPAQVIVTQQPDRPASPRPQREAMKRAVSISILIVGIGFLIFHWLGGGENNGAAKPLSNTSFVEFDSKFCVHSRLTDAQKNKEIDSYKGQRVRWEGIVEYVSDDSVGFKHKATTQTYDVLVEIARSGRADLTALNQGDLTTYEGTIDDYGVVMAHSLSDGKIVSHHALSAGDQMMFLAKTETAVMERIGGTDKN